MRLECLAPTYIISSSLLPAAPPAGVVLAFHMEILKHTCTQDLPIYHFGGTDLSTTYLPPIYHLSTPIYHLSTTYLPPIYQLEPGPIYHLSTTYLPPIYPYLPIPICQLGPGPIYLLKHTCTQDLPIYHFGETDLSSTYTGIIYCLGYSTVAVCTNLCMRMYKHIAQLAYWLVLSPVCKQPDLIVTQHHGSDQQLSD